MSVYLFYAYLLHRGLNASKVGEHIYVWQNGFSVQHYYNKINCCHRIYIEWYARRWTHSYYNNERTRRGCVHFSSIFRRDEPYSRTTVQFYRFLTIYLFELLLFSIQFILIMAPIKILVNTFLNTVIATDIKSPKIQVKNPVTET